MQILACQGMRVATGRSSILFAATWEVRAVGTNTPAIKHGGFTADAVDWDGENYSQLATQLSAAVAAVDKALAADLPMEPKHPGEKHHPLRQITNFLDRIRISILRRSRF
jgi:hypothetical protein